MVSLLPFLAVLAILGILGVYSILRRDRFKSQGLVVLLASVGGIAISLIAVILIVGVIDWTYVNLEEASKDQPLTNTIVRGGPIVMVLFFLLILTMAFFFERVYTIAILRGKSSKEHLLEQVLPLIKQKKFDEAQVICSQHHGSAGRLVGALLTRFALLHGKVSDKVLRQELNLTSEETSAMEQSMVERNLIGIATIGSIANLLGLLGTVMGMIRSFAAMSMGQATKSTHIELATGISQALVCAAGGLVVAIPAVVFYNYFTSRADRFMMQLNEVSIETLQSLRKEI